MTDTDPVREETPEPRPWNQLPEPTGVREGYPALEPGHTLFAEQEAGWPNYLPHEAWNAVIAAAPVAGFANSAGHPAYDESYIGNPLATRPDQEPPVNQPVLRHPDKERR